MIKYFIGGVIAGVLIGIISVGTFQLYKPTIIHDTIQPRIDSIIRIENSYFKTINQTKIIYESRKDSINNIPDSFQFDLFRSNCQRYSFLLSNDSASQD